MGARRRAEPKLCSHLWAPAEDAVAASSPRHLSHTGGIGSLSPTKPHANTPLKHFHCSASLSDTGRPAEGSSKSPISIHTWAPHILPFSQTENKRFCLRVTWIQALAPSFPANPSLVPTSHPQCQRRSTVRPNVWLQSCWAHNTGVIINHTSPRHRHAFDKLFSLISGNNLQHLGDAVMSCQRIILRVSLMWEDTGSPRGNPHHHGKNTQTSSHGPQRALNRVPPAVRLTANHWASVRRNVCYVQISAGWRHSESVGPLSNGPCSLDLHTSAPGMDALKTVSKPISAE